MDQFDLFGGYTDTGIAIAAAPIQPRIVVDFFVPGLPRPGGSKTATVIRRKGGEIVAKNGRPLVTMRDDAKGNAEWRQSVAVFGCQAYDGDPLDQPLAVRMTFFMPRPKGHYGSGKNADRIKDSAPRHPLTKPDALKLARSTEDALTGIIWRDDCLTVDLLTRKRYADDGRIGARIEVFAL